MIENICWRLPALILKQHYIDEPCAMSLVHIYASINVKPGEGGGGPWAYVGHLTSIAFPSLGKLMKNLGPKVETFAFFARKNGT